MATLRLCSIPDCGKHVEKRGWCNNHYQLWRRHGDPMKKLCAANGEPMRYFLEVVLTYTGNECLTWPYARNGDGHAHMVVDGDNKRIARLVCEHFEGPPPTPEHHAAHSCGKGHEGCVAKEHLSWKTPVENNADKLIHGTHKRGERCNFAKLKAEDVLYIRSQKGKIKQRTLAAKFNVGQSRISLIQNRKDWAWLD